VATVCLKMRQGGQWELDASLENHSNHLCQPTSAPISTFLTEPRGKYKSADGMSVAGERTGPGDVAMAGGIAGVLSFGEDPTITLKDLAERKEIGGDVLLAFREPFLGGGKLVHESETKVMLFAGKVDRGEYGRVVLGSFPTNLTAQTGFVPGSLNVSDHAKEIEEDCANEIPILGAAGKEAAEPEVVAFDFINIEDGKIALATGSDIEAHAIRAFGGQDFVEGAAQESVDVILAPVFVIGIESSEALNDFAGFEVDAFDLVISAAEFDSRPIDNVIGG